MPGDPFKRDTEKVSLYLPPELKAWLQQIAASHRRSVNAELVTIVEEARKRAERRRVLP